MTGKSYDIQFKYRHAIPLPAATLYLINEPKAR
jgi:hypothetical protein